MPCPVSFWEPKAKSLGRRPFLPFLALSPFPPPLRGGKPPSPSSPVAWSVVERPTVRVELGALAGSEEEAVVASIPVVCLPTDVVTAERVVTSGKASPQLGVTISPCGGRACGETVLLTWLLGVSRGDTWLFLPNLLEVRDVGACVVRLWSHVVAPVFRELLYLGRCVPRCCFRIAFDSTVPAALAGKGLVIPTEPCSRGSPPYSLQVASFPAGSECKLQKSVVVAAGCACFERSHYFARAAVGFVFGLRVHVGVSRRLREPTCDVTFTSAGLLPVDPGGVSIFARAKQMLVCRVAPLVERGDTYLWLLSALCWLVVNSGEVLPEFFSIGSSGGLFRACFCRLLCYLKVEVCCCYVGWCVLVGFPEWRLGGFGGERFLGLWVEVLPKLPYVCFGLYLGIVDRAVLPLAMCLAVALARFSSVHFVHGSLVSAMGVWLFVLLWKRLVVRVSFPCFPLFARGDVAPLWCCVARVRIVVTFGWSHLLLSCFWVELVAPLVPSVCPPLVKVVDIDPVCSPVFWPAVGAVGYCTLSVFPFDVSCGESFLLAMLFWPLVQLCCILPGFGACGGTKCSCPSGLCGAVWSPVCSVFKALSFPPLGHIVLAMPCGCTITVVGWLLCLVWVALLVVRQALVVACVQTMRMIWVGSSGADGHCPVCRGVLHVHAIDWLWVTIKKLSFGLAVVFLVGLVPAAPVELSTSACVLCAIVVHPVSHRMSVVWTIPGCSITAICLPDDVATAERIAALEKASPCVGRRPFWGFPEGVSCVPDPQPRASVRGSSLGGGHAQVTNLEKKGKTVGTVA
ncbi:hypothetical protein Taro_046112 [Colocasia esculenta]|uniref:Uncharacterized protein n=1 Tax=Colocasia esculenta TaxID=4460 RepID=A0A843WSY3_COLES|nr:hypothetical protein [Colocasia esculenta]